MKAGKHSPAGPPENATGALGSRVLKMQLTGSAKCEELVSKRQAGKTSLQEGSTA